MLARPSTVLMPILRLSTWKAAMDFLWYNFLTMKCGVDDWHVGLHSSCKCTVVKLIINAMFQLRPLVAILYMTVFCVVSPIGNTALQWSLTALARCGSGYGALQSGAGGGDGHYSSYCTPGIQLVIWFNDLKYVFLLLGTSNWQPLLCCFLWDSGEGATERCAGSFAGDSHLNTSIHTSPRPGGVHGMWIYLHGPPGPGGGTLGVGGGGCR